MLSEWSHVTEEVKDFQVLMSEAMNKAESHQTTKNMQKVSKTLVYSYFVCDHIIKLCCVFERVCQGLFGVYMFVLESVSLVNQVPRSAPQYLQDSSQPAVLPQSEDHSAHRAKCVGLSPTYSS